MAGELPLSRCGGVSQHDAGDQQEVSLAWWAGLGGGDHQPEYRSREKLDFYAKAGTRELLLLDRDPWSLELYRFDGGVPALVMRSDVEGGMTLETQVAPLLWRLVAGPDRPVVEVSKLDGSQMWTA